MMLPYMARCLIIGMQSIRYPAVDGGKSTSTCGAKCHNVSQRWQKMIGEVVYRPTVS